MKRHPITITFTQGCVLTLALYILLAIGLYAVAGPQLRWQAADQTIFIPDSTDGAEPLYGDHRLEQTFRPAGDRLDYLAFKSCTYGRENTGTLTAELLSEDGALLLREEFDMARLPDNGFVTMSMERPVAVSRDSLLTLRLTGQHTEVDRAASAVYHREAAAPGGQLSYDGVPLPGAICMEARQSVRLWFGTYYLWIAVGGGLLLALALWRLCRARKTGAHSPLLDALAAFSRYRFLLKQLVSRDFKTKYKRSVLGVLWSFLNPLLTMTVQYVVFSTLFRNDIRNFPAYLLIGGVFFNFFSEACGMGLSSIVGNAPLITKVSIPKYIFPVSRVLSSFVNFALALIPLFLVVLVTGQPLTKAVLLLPFSLACVLVFSLGMTLILSAMMVFFRDVQFLWSVISMLWMYATPIFYPESIIPAQFLFLYKMNPLYHFIRFTRIIILDGVSPEPRAYLFCMLAAVIPLALGLALFRRTQDHFVLNI